MNATTRQIVRHAAVFSIGGILFRLASVILLPVYTHYLNPADYGVMAILDLTIGLLSVVVSGGIASAATRAHFDDRDERHRDRVWWTAVLMVVASATVLLGTAFAFRTRLATFVFGPGLPRGSYYFAVALPTLWIGSVLVPMDAYFRALKSSSYVVAVGLFRLVVNIVLNVVLLAWFGMGIAGVLWGNLISAGAAMAVMGSRFVSVRRHPAMDWGHARAFWGFGWPLVVVGLFSLVMHEADRYILRFFVDLRQVGIYSVAYQIGQGVNTLVIAPFAAIWGVLIYDVARQADAKATYARVFQHYVLALSVVLLLAALTAGPILHVIAPPDYAPASDIVPVVCLAYLFFSLHDHFKVPALLASRTVALLPVVVVAAAANVVLNLLFIPRFGAMAAAWTSVATFALFAIGGLLQYRRIDRYNYPFVVCAGAVGGMVVTYAVHRALVVPYASLPVQMAVATALWLVWIVALFGPAVKEFGKGRLSFEAVRAWAAARSDRSDIAGP